MGSCGDCFDNGLAESTEVFEASYNTIRRLATLGDL